MTDQQIIQGLIARDNAVTQEFFFERCRSLFYAIMQRVFSYEVDYDEFINELYMEFGGKLFDDMHASRVLPGFRPDSKLAMLTQLRLFFIMLSTARISSCPRISPVSSTIYMIASSSLSTMTPTAVTHKINSQISYETTTFL